MYYLASSAAIAIIAVGCHGGRLAFDVLVFMAKCIAIRRRSSTIEDVENENGGKNIGEHLAIWRKWREESSACENGGKRTERILISQHFQKRYLTDRRLRSILFNS